MTSYSRNSYLVRNLNVGADIWLIASKNPFFVGSECHIWWVDAYFPFLETLIQLSGTFVALISGFAVSRYFSNFGEVQRLAFQRRLLAPRLERLSDLVEFQKVNRIGNENERIVQELIRSFNENDTISDEELLDILDARLSEQEVLEIISKFRQDRQLIDEQIQTRLGNLIPIPSQETLDEYDIVYTPENLPVYIDALRRYRDKKKIELGRDSPFKIDMRNFDALTRMTIPILPNLDLHTQRKSEEENVEDLLVLEHEDKLLESAIKVRQFGMKMKSFFVSSSISSFFGIIVPALLLIVDLPLDLTTIKFVFFSGLVITILSSFGYVGFTIKSTRKQVNSF